MKNLTVEDEIYPDCVKIEGLIYNKKLLRELGKRGMPVGQCFRIIAREPDGAVTISRLGRLGLLEV